MSQSPKRARIISSRETPSFETSTVGGVANIHILAKGNITCREGIALRHIMNNRHFVFFSGTTLLHGEIFPCGQVYLAVCPEFDFGFAAIRARLSVFQFQLGFTAAAHFVENIDVVFCVECQGIFVPVNFVNDIDVALARFFSVSAFQGEIILFQAFAGFGAGHVAVGFSDIEILRVNQPFPRFAVFCLR